VDAVPVEGGGAPWAGYSLPALTQRIGLLRRALERGEGPAYALGGLLDAAFAAELEVLRVVGGATEVKRRGPPARLHHGTPREPTSLNHRAEQAEHQGHGTAYHGGRTSLAA